jgi:hypothetical protein
MQFILHSGPVPTRCCGAGEQLSDIPTLLAGERESIEIPVDSVTFLFAMLGQATQNGIIEL